MTRGGSLYDLKEILGHSDIKMTMRYAHLSPQHLRAGMERMEGLTRRPMAHSLAQSGIINRAQQHGAPQALESVGTPP